MANIAVTLEGETTRDLPPGTTVGSLAPPVASSALPYIAALVNNDVASLSYPLTVNSRVRFLTAAHPLGWRIYRRSLCFLLAKAVRDLYPTARFTVEHSFGLGLYCAFAPDPSAPEGIDEPALTELERHMRLLVEQDLPIERRKIAYTDAVRQFEEAGQVEKLNLLRFRNPPRVVLHWCAGFLDLAHGPLAPSTGVLTHFKLIPYKAGFVLHLPDRTAPTQLPPFEDQPHLFQIFREHKDWGRILGVTTVGRLNEIIAGGQFEEFVRTAEALHEKKLARIADQIADARDRVKVILIAGPSCAGKTTFAKRLMTHLTVNGLRPIVISTDDYFVGLEQNPKGPDGTPDFEHLEAVDLDLFNDHLAGLIAGREVRLPWFDFETKQQHPDGPVLRVSEGEVIIVEGIHGLNPRLTTAVPAERKFRVYVSALTQLSVDSNNRISTTDNRLMRRLIRDFRFRGHDTLTTLRLWTSVRRGEKTWIFPFQREADATFNSALDYELAVLKPLVEPLLLPVKPSDPEYAEARRLSEFLLNFLVAPDRPVPRTSILREYIGGSILHY